jgi:hypothetical protein
VDGAPLARVFGSFYTALVGAAMCPACSCGLNVCRWP